MRLTPKDRSITGTSEGDGNMGKLDLLYAHGMLCSHAEEHTYQDKDVAKRLCDVINNFQSELKDHLIPNAKPFIVKHYVQGFYSVEPLGGWDG